MITLHWGELLGIIAIVAACGFLLAACFSASSRADANQAKPAAPVPFRKTLPITPPDDGRKGRFARYHENMRAAEMRNLSERHATSRAVRLATERCWQ